MRDKTWASGKQPVGVYTGTNNTDKQIQKGSSEKMVKILDDSQERVQNFFFIWKDGRDFCWFTILGASHTNTKNTSGEIFVNYKDNISKSEVWNLFQENCEIDSLTK